MPGRQSWRLSDRRTTRRCRRHVTGRHISSGNCAPKLGNLCLRSEQQKNRGVGARGRGHGSARAACRRAKTAWSSCESQTPQPYSRILESRSISPSGCHNLWSCYRGHPVCRKRLTRRRSRCDQETALPSGVTHRGKALFRHMLAPQAGFAWRPALS